MTRIWRRFGNSAMDDPHKTLADALKAREIVIAPDALAAILHDAGLHLVPLEGFKNQLDWDRTMRTPA